MNILIGDDYNLEQFYTFEPYFFVTSDKCNHRHKMIERDFIESAIINTPELSYKYQIYILKNGYTVKKHYRKTLSAAYKVQNKNIGE